MLQSLHARGRGRRGCAAPAGQAAPHQRLRPSLCRLLSRGAHTSPTWPRTTPAGFVRSWTLTYAWPSCASAREQQHGSASGTLVQAAAGRSLWDSADSTAAAVVLTRPTRPAYPEQGNQVLHRLARQWPAKVRGHEAPAERDCGGGRAAGWRSAGPRGRRRRRCWQPSPPPPQPPSAAHGLQTEGARAWAGWWWWRRSRPPPAPGTRPLGLRRRGRPASVTPGGRLGIGAASCTVGSGSAGGLIRQRQTASGHPG